MMKMFKRLVSLCLATALALPAAGMVALAAPSYLVDGISGKAYLLDDDGFVDMSHVVSSTPYGKKFYYPLLNDGGTYQYQVDYDKAVAERKTTEAPLNQAIAAYLSALTEEMKKALPDYSQQANFQDYKFDKLAFQAAFEQAKKKAESANSNEQSAVQSFNEAKAALIETLGLYQNSTNDAVKQAAASEISKLENLKNKLDQATNNASGKTAELLAFANAFDANAIAQISAYDTWKKADQAYTPSLRLNPAQIKSYEGAKAIATTMYQSPTTTYQQAATLVKKYVDAFATMNKDETNANNHAGAINAGLVNGASTQAPADGASEWSLILSKEAQTLLAFANIPTARITAYDTWKKAGENPLTAAQSSAYEAVKQIDNYQTKAKAIKAASANYGNDESTKLSTLTTQLGAYQTAQAGLGGTQKNNATLVQAYENALLKVTALVTKKGDYDSKLAAEQRAKTALEKAKTSYPYVWEYDAAGKIKVRAKWQQNGALVGNVGLVKKRLAFSTGSAPAWMTGNQRSAYFVEVTLKPGSSTASRDLYGTITLTQSGTYKVSETLDAFMTVSYSNIGSNNNDIITKTPSVYSISNGGFTEDEQIFTFEADDNSTFTVDTSGADKALLGMNTNFDSTISGKYPSANFDFYNGNGGSFNRVGEWFIPAKQGNYLYQVNSDGTLSQAKNAEYDRNADGFLVKTRTLGRYVVSDQKLKLSSNDGGSSSSSSSNVIVVEPTPGGNYNPPTGAAL